MANCKAAGWVLRIGALLALCPSSIRAQIPSSTPQDSAAPSVPAVPPEQRQDMPMLQSSPSPSLPPNMNLPALSPAPTQQSVPPGPNAQQAPNAQMQPPPISPLSQHVDTPELPAPQITSTMNSTVRPEREGAHGLTKLPWFPRPL